MIRVYCPFERFSLCRIHLITQEQDRTQFSRKWRVNEVCLSQIVPTCRTNSIKRLISCVFASVTKISISNRKNEYARTNLISIQIYKLGHFNIGLTPNVIKVHYRFMRSSGQPRAGFRMHLIAQEQERTWLSLKWRVNVICLSQTIRTRGTNSIKWHISSHITFIDEQFCFQPQKRIPGNKFDHGIQAMTFRYWTYHKRDQSSLTFCATLGSTPSRVSSLSECTRAKPNMTLMQ